MQRQNVKSSFAIHEVVVLTGFTKYMLDYLMREDIFSPSAPSASHRGLRRRYTYEDVVLLRALHVICAGKGKIRHLKEALMRFRTEFGRLVPGRRLDKQLFVQGDELCIYSPAEGGRQLRTGQLTLSFVIDMAVISGEIAKCVVVNPKSGQFALTPAVARKAEEERQRIWAPVKARRAELKG